MSGSATAFATLAIRNYNRFFFGSPYRFLPDLTADVSLQTGNQVVARDSARSKFIFFNEDTDQVILNLSTMDAPHKVVRLDPYSSVYNEVSLGTYSPGIHTISALDVQDWVFAVGNFSATLETDPTPPDIVVYYWSGRGGSLELDGEQVTIAGTRPVTPDRGGLKVKGLIPHAFDGTIDSTAPTIPEIVSAFALDPVTVVLNWTTSTDVQSGVSGYDVIVNGLIATSVQANTITLTGLAEDTPYTFEIVAVDGVGNRAASGSAVVRTPLDVSLPPPDIMGSATSHDVIRVKWTMKDKPGQANVRFYVYRDRVKVYTTDEAFQVFRHLDPDTAYTFNVQAYDEDGNVSELSKTLVLRTDEVGRIVEWKRLPDR